MTATSTNMYCLQCKAHTRTSDLKIVEKATEKMGICFYLQGTCEACSKNKSKRLGKQLPAGYTKGSTDSQLAVLLSNGKAPVTAKPITRGSALPTEEVITASVVTQNLDKADVDGDGLWDNIKNMGRKRTFADKLGDTAASATKSFARNIPLVGDLLVDTGIVDKGIDLFSEYVWQPMKKWFGGSLDDSYIQHLKNNNRALSDLAERAMELRIKSGDGIIPKYLGELRSGSEEDKALAHVLMKTVCKPKFYKYLKEQNVPSTMSILEAMTKYKSRDKPHRNDEEKALSILKELGYDSI